MAKFSVERLGEIEQLVDPKSASYHRPAREYGADVLVRPPFVPGEGLGDFLSGLAGEIVVEHIMSDNSAEDGFTHLQIRTATSMFAKPEDVNRATSRLVRYLNSEPENIANLSREFREDPI